MDNVKEIITIVSAVVGILITITSFLIPLVKNSKAKKQLTAVNQIAGVLQNLVIEAEKFVNYSGEEKKQYVMTLANRYALENNLPYDEDYISAKIEELVSLSKQVNSKTTTNTQQQSSCNNNEEVVSIKL